MTCKSQTNRAKTTEILAKTWTIWWPTLRCFRIWCACSKVEISSNKCSLKWTHRAVEIAKAVAWTLWTISRWWTTWTVWWWTTCKAWITSIWWANHRDWIVEARATRIWRLVRCSIRIWMTLTSSINSSTSKARTSIRTPPTIQCTSPEEDKQPEVTMMKTLCPALLISARFIPLMRVSHTEILPLSHRIPMLKASRTSQIARDHKRILKWQCLMLMICMMKILSHLIRDTSSSRIAINLGAMERWVAWIAIIQEEISLDQIDIRMRDRSLWEWMILVIKRIMILVMTMLWHRDSLRTLMLPIKIKRSPKTTITLMKNLFMVEIKIMHPKIPTMTILKITLALKTKSPPSKPNNRIDTTQKMIDPSSPPKTLVLLPLMISQSDPTIMPKIKDLPPQMDPFQDRTRESIKKKMMMMTTTPNLSIPTKTPSMRCQSLAKITKDSKIY